MSATRDIHISSVDPICGSCCSIDDDDGGGDDSNDDASR